MSGLQISELSSSEMLDVIHVLFEEDYTSAVSGEQVDAKNKIRKIMYKEFYDKTYMHGGSSNDYSEEPLGAQVDYSDVTPFDPKKAAVKPFVPATDINENSPKPFGKVLDGPLG
jgi:hypothetical protein